MAVFIVLHLLLRFAWFLTVLFVCRTIELLLVGAFCMLSLWGMAKYVCSFGVLLFSELFLLFLSRPSFLVVFLSSRISSQICTLLRVIRN